MKRVLFVVELLAWCLAQALAMPFILLFLGGVYAFLSLEEFVGFTKRYAAARIAGLPMRKAWAKAGKPDVLVVNALGRR